MGPVALPALALGCAAIVAAVAALASIARRPTWQARPANQSILGCSSVLLAIAGLLLALYALNLSGNLGR